VGGASASGCAVTTDDELVDAITRALKPWAPQMTQAESGEIEVDPQPEKAISAAVRAEIVRFRSTVPGFLHRDAIRKTREDARSIIKLASTLEDRISEKTLSPELRLRLGQHDRLIGSAADIANMPVPRLLRTLKEIRNLCQAADDNQPGTDEVKRWCALIAFRLIRTFSTDDPSAGSDNTAYCTIAGLLYESVTNKEERLRGVCQSVLEPYQSLLRG
jgi:hypothetical protein